MLACKKGYTNTFRFDLIERAAARVLQPRVYCRACVLQAGGMLAMVSCPLSGISMNAASKKVGQLQAATQTHQCKHFLINTADRVDGFSPVKGGGACYFTPQGRSSLVSDTAWDSGVPTPPNQVRERREQRGLTRGEEGAEGPD